MKKQTGFTIIELLIATTVFSLILVVITVGVMSFTRSYYRGVTAASTQNVARTTMDDVTQAVQLSGLDVRPTADDNPKISVQSNAKLRTRGYCVGSTLYSYLPGWQLKTARNPAAYQNTHVLVRSTPNGGCAGNDTVQPQDLLGPVANIKGTELLTPNMRVSKFELANVSGDPNLYSMVLRIVYGDADLLGSTGPGADEVIRATNNDATCKNATAGTQFCAVSELSTLIHKRVN